ncbi:MAG: SbcC/MukB-like Walker B domain-containing protein [Verrucomicrobiales bacterium]|nr:SbcC/MukB-like Walker B domain-containing protein [Verrucomicrobiota bacterium JB025]
MSRAIQLTKIHALNWYGYRDSLPVKGNLVLAGVTGSGKSILMDLLMLVLVGPEKARHHFNRSATGGRSDRTIKGYCLLDTKREENGQPQFFHHKGVTTYIAAEFTWPDGSRVETWGLRFEYRNTTESDGTSTPFFCPAPLERADFLTTSEDGKSRPSPLADFKRMVDSKGGRLFSSPRAYLRDMANPSHLNFNQEILHRLLPSAMSFTNLKSFDDFCRQFVLPADTVDVDDVISSFRDFQSYEKELADLRAQLNQLQRIRDLSLTLSDAERDRAVAGYLAAEFSWRHATHEADKVESRLKQLREDHADDEARFDELVELIDESNQRREHLNSLLNESSEGRLFKRLSDEIGKLEDDIERLRNLATKINGGLGKRIKSARSWMDQVAKAPVHPFVDTTPMARAIEFLDSCERSETSNTLSLLADAANELCKTLRNRFARDAEELRKLRSEKNHLESQIDLLKKGVSPGHQPLLAALRDSLPLLPGQAPPRALRELCEVDDEDWRNAAEIAFEEKFAVIVPPEHHAQALEILNALPESDLVEAGPQHLIDAEKHRSAKPRQLKHSLAGILRCDDPAARACIDHLFGRVIRVSSLEEFESRDSAILPNGLIKRDGTATRPRPYDGIPFIGEEGLRKQLELKRMRLGEIDATLRRLEPVEQEVERLIAARQREFPEHQSIAENLVRIEELPRMEDKHDKLMAEYNAIATDQLSSLREQIEDLKQQTSNWDHEKNAILRKGAHREIKHAEDQLASLTEQAGRREDEFSRIKLRIDISKYRDRCESWKQEAQEYTPALDVCAREFTKAAAAAELQATETIGNLKVAMLEFKKSFHPKFDDLPDDGAHTDAYIKRLEIIENANIPEYEKKSATERKRWETLFRTQVLSRMQQAIKNVENIISLLNQQLKRPIGQDRYKIDKKPNPDFKIYRDLIDLNAVHHEDELFFSSMSGEMRDTLESFLGILVKNANSPEAARLLDYRQYFDYDLLVSDIRDPDAKPVSVDKQSGKMSGGENQSPYFIAILASYLHAYNRHERRRKEPSLALVPIDEAFSKLSGERIQNCIQAMSELDLQGMFSMSSGNIPYAFRQCGELIVISRKEERNGSRVGVRNVPIVLFRDSPEGRRWIEEQEPLAADG